MRMVTYTNELWKDFISNIFPSICVHCKTTLVRDEAYLCSKCKISLPKTNLHLIPQNRLFQKFAFEPKVKFVAAYLEYNRLGIARKLIHHLKYKNNPELGVLMGQWYGNDLLDIKLKPDVIVPVPLHPRKYKIRGFNQSESIADGLSNEINVPVVADFLVRKIYTKTQTKKSRINRWQNVDSIFAINPKHVVTDKKILLVDDVLTTGATLGSITSLLAKHKVSAIYIVTIAAGA